MNAAARRIPVAGEERLVAAVKLRSAVEVIYRLEGADGVLRALERARIDFLEMHRHDPALTGWIR